MLSPRSLIRYALPGGFGVLVLAACETVYDWAWHQSSALDGFCTAGAGPIALGGWAVVVGFAISEIVYRQLDRPYVHCGVTIRLPRWTPASWRACVSTREICLGTFYAADLGGAVLCKLLDLPACRPALAYAHGVDAASLAVEPPPSGATPVQRDAYAECLRRHLAALHALIRLAASTGELEIHRNYVDQASTLHAVGASRVALCTISGAALLDLMASHRYAFAAHLPSSIEASAMLALTIALAWRALCCNLRSRWVLLRDELSHDLRSWALRHPQELAALSGPNARAAVHRSGSSAQDIGRVLGASGLPTR